MPNELCAAGGGGLEEAPVSAMNSPTKRSARRGSRQVKQPRRERGQRGGSSSPKVKLTPGVIGPLQPQPAFIWSLIGSCKRTEAPS